MPTFSSRVGNFRAVIYRQIVTEIRNQPEMNDSRLRTTKLRIGAVEQAGLGGRI